MATDEYDRCLDRVIQHAETLKRRADAGEINHWNIENLLNGYVDVPSIFALWRDRLVQDALKHIGMEPDHDA